MLSRTAGDTSLPRPCSRYVYQVVLTPARTATSSRRNPGVRRRPAMGKPTSLGFICSRRARRNLASSASRPDASVTAASAWLED
jgi:hypothetical protein